MTLTGNGDSVYPRPRESSETSNTTWPSGWPQAPGPLDRLLALETATPKPPVNPQEDE